MGFRQQMSVTVNFRFSHIAYLKLEFSPKLRISQAEKNQTTQFHITLQANKKNNKLFEAGQEITSSEDKNELRKIFLSL